MIPLWNNLEPPNIALDADVRWLLSVAFQWKSTLTAGPGSLDRALGIAQRLDLLELVAHRLGRNELASGVDRNDARLKAADARYRARRADHEATLRQAMGLATRTGATLALAGQTALAQVGSSSLDDDRVPTEITLLATEQNVRSIGKALSTIGAPKIVLEPTRDPVVACRSKGGTRVVVRSSLPFVRLVLGGRFADLPALARCGFLMRAAEWGDDVWALDETTLAAQLVAQGVVVDRFAAPRTLLQRLLDLQALELFAKDLRYDVHALIGTDVLYAEFDGLLKLAAALSAGHSDTLEPPAKIWLDHALASVLSRGYRARLLPQAEFLRLQRHVRAAWVEQGFSAPMVLGAARTYLQEGLSKVRTRSRDVP